MVLVNRKDTVRQDEGFSGRPSLSHAFIRIMGYKLTSPIFDQFSYPSLDPRHKRKMSK